MSKKVRFGLIGCGAIAKFHAKSIGEIEGAELVAAFDPYKPGLEKFVAEYGVKGYDTLDAMLADPDVDQPGSGGDEGWKACRLRKADEPYAG